MNMALRVVLIFFSVSTLFFTLYKIRNAKVEITASIFWILLVITFVIISIFPNISLYISEELLGFDSNANFVFLCVIFVLLIKVFTLSLQVSKQQHQLQQLSQLYALEKQQKQGQTNAKN